MGGYMKKTIWGTIIGIIFITAQLASAGECRYTFLISGHQGKLLTRNLYDINLVPQQCYNECNKLLKSMPDAIHGCFNTESKKYPTIDKKTNICNGGDSCGSPGNE